MKHRLRRPIDARTRPLTPAASEALSGEWDEHPLPRPCVDCGGPTEPDSELYAEPLCRSCATQRGAAETEARRLERERLASKPGRST